MLKEGWEGIVYSASLTETERSVNLFPLICPIKGWWNRLWEVLAANHRHATVRALEAFIANIVFQLFMPDGITDGIGNRFIVCR